MADILKISEPECSMAICWKGLGCWIKHYVSNFQEAVGTFSLWIKSRAAVQPHVLAAEWLSPIWSVYSCHKEPSCLVCDVVSALYSKAKACSCGTLLLVKEHQQNLESAETSLGKLELFALIWSQKSLNKLLEAKPLMRPCLHKQFPFSGVRECLEKPTKTFGMQWDREENIIHFFFSVVWAQYFTQRTHKGKILAARLLLELKINLARENERQQVSLVNWFYCNFIQTPYHSKHHVSK